MHSAGISSLSTPVSGSIDPFAQMEFDPQSIQQFDDGYDGLQDGLEGLTFEGFDDVDLPDGMNMEKMPEALDLPSFPGTGDMSTPIDIPSPKQQPGSYAPDASGTGFPYFHGMSNPGMNH